MMARANVDPSTRNEKWILGSIAETNGCLQGSVGSSFRVEGEPQRVNIVADAHKGELRRKGHLQSGSLTAITPSTLISNCATFVTCQWRRTDFPSKSTRLINPALSCASIRLHRQPTHTITSTHRLC
jgi:hypothetical protein